MLTEETGHRVVTIIERMILDFQRYLELKYCEIGPEENPIADCLKATVFLV
jgi:hypothetical protein